MAKASATTTTTTTMRGKKEEQQKKKNGRKKRNVGIGFSFGFDDRRTRRERERINHRLHAYKYVFIYIMYSVCVCVCTILYNIIRERQKTNIAVRDVLYAVCRFTVADGMRRYLRDEVKKLRPTTKLYRLRVVILCCMHYILWCQCVYNFDSHN